MGFQNRRILFVVSALLLISSALYITANIIPKWGKKSVESGSITIGLWAKCYFDGSCEKYRQILPPVMSKRRYDLLMFTRAFVTLSCILTSLSALLILSILFISEYLRRTILIWAKIFSLGSLIGGIVGVIIGIAFVKKDEFNLTYDLGFSSILAIIAVSFNLFGTILTTLISD